MDQNRRSSGSYLRDPTDTTYCHPIKENPVRTGGTTPISSGIYTFSPIFHQLYFPQKPINISTSIKYGRLNMFSRPLYLNFNQIGVIEPRDGLQYR
ncbi:MAG: hypothetical protein AAF959_18085 [Cyanobacteria bacterium P01_D01_bin.56]